MPTRGIRAGADLRSRVRAGELVVGCLLPYDAPWLVEMMGLVGFDFVVIDVEHETFDDGSVASLIRAAGGAGLASVVRAPYSDRLQPFLSAGATGVQIPGLSSGTQVRSVVEGLRPPPSGRRPYYTQGRSAGYGLGLDEVAHLQKQDAEFLLIGMVESVEAVEHLDSILAVSGLDVIHIGPLDLAQSMGFPPAADVERLIESIVARSLAAGRQVSVGVVTPGNVGGIARWVEHGVSFFSVASAWVLADAVAGFYDQVWSGIPTAVRSRRRTARVPANPYLGASQDG